MAEEQGKRELPIEVFVSCANQDASLRQQLEKHLALLVEQRKIRLWSRDDIPPGAVVEHSSSTYLDKASLILLLISADFIASDTCMKELNRALERQQSGKAIVLLVFLRETNIRDERFEQLPLVPRNGSPVTNWRERNAAFSDIVVGIREAIDYLLSPPDARPGTFSLSPNKPSLPQQRVRHRLGRRHFVSDFLAQQNESIVPKHPPFTVPYQPVPFFTGREKVLEDLHHSFRPGEMVALVQPQALTGLGGIGKTQTAVQYAYRSRNDYGDGVFWVKADTQETFRADLAACAYELGLLPKERNDQDYALKIFQQWLKEHNKWLLVFDNVENLDMLKESLPVAHNGHILLTTRRQDVRSTAIPIPIKQMEPDEDALFLLRRSGIIRVDMTLDQAPEAERTLARTISEKMGGLPLALEQAGAYIEATQCGLTGYLERYEQEPDKFLDEKEPDDHPESAVKTFSLLFKQIEEKDKDATQLLRLCALFHPDAIPEELIADCAGYLDSKILTRIENQWSFDAILEELSKHSLIYRNTSQKTLTIHRIVQEVLKKEMPEDTLHLMAESAVKAANDCYPDAEIVLADHTQRYFPHGLVCLEYISHWKMISPEVANLLNQIGRIMFLHPKDTSGSTEKAKDLCEQALAMRRELFGQGHEDVCQSLRSLSEFYFQQKQYKQSTESFLQMILTYGRIIDNHKQKGVESNIGGLPLKC